MPTRVVAYILAALLLGVLAEEYLRGLRSAADSDRYAACRTLGPAPSPTLGPLPVVAPPFTVLDYTGQKTSLAAYRGKVVFLNFWQTTCGPCVEEMPSMERLSRRLGTDDFVILGLASEESFAPIHNFFPAGTTMTMLLDPPDAEHTVGDVSRRYGTEKWPETYLIDRDGRVRYYFINARKWDSDNARACVRTLLAE